MSWMIPRMCLVLVENICLGYQVSTVLRNKGWQTYVVYRDYEAYALILRGEAHAIVADVDAPNLGGLTVLTYCYQHYPSIETYAVLESDDSESGKMAREVACCHGYFYRADDTLRIDTDHRIPTDWTTGLTAH